MYSYINSKMHDIRNAQIFADKIIDITLKEVCYKIKNIKIDGLCIEEVDYNCDDYDEYDYIMFNIKTNKLYIELQCFISLKYVDYYQSYWLSDDISDEEKDGKIGSIISKIESVLFREV